MYEHLLEAVIGLLTATTIYLGVLTRNAKKIRKLPSEALRSYIEERAEHKSRNVVNAALPEAVARIQGRVDQLSDSERDHGERLVRVEGQIEDLIRRMDERDKLAERDRVEEMASLNRIERKVDALMLRGGANQDA